MIKNQSGVTNRVADALSRRHSLLTKMKVEVLGFDEMKELYDVDTDFSEALRECRALNLKNHISMMIISFKKVYFSEVFIFVFLEVLWG